MRQRSIACAALAVPLLALAVACTEESRSPSLQQAGAPMAGAIPKVEYMVDTSTVELPIEGSAQLYSEHDAVVVARTAGTIDSLFAELGDRVRARQSLARMESTEQEIALASAEASLENVGRAQWRVRELRKSGGVTPADSELVEFQLRQAQIARRKAQHDVELTRLVAPFAGVVTARLARPGRFVAVGDTLFRVTEPAPLYARVRVPESSGRSLRVGDAASVVGPSGTVSASIVHAAPFVDAASGTREIVLELRSAGSLLAGSSVSVRLGREKGRVTSVPRAAIAPEGYAVVVENGRSTLRPVTLGRDIGNGRVEVLSGLSPGERLARPTR